MFVLVRAITLQPQWLFPSLWKINRRMRNKTAHETRPWEVAAGKGGLDPHSCGESATIIHRRPEDRNKLMVFYWPALHNEIENKREIHLLSGRQNGGDCDKRTNFPVAFKSAKISIWPGNAGFSFFFPAAVRTVKASWCYSDKYFRQIDFISKDFNPDPRDQRKACLTVAWYHSWDQLSTCGA